MSDILEKYTFGGVKITFASIKKLFSDTAAAHHEDKNFPETVAYAQITAALLVSSCKEKDASISVIIKNMDTAYGAVAENDGRICGYYEKIPVSDNEKTILEITRRLYLRGDYKSVVCADNTENAVNEYLTTSLQSEAKFALWKTDNGAFSGLLIEQFPITKPEQEIWRNSANREFEYLSPIIGGDMIIKRELFKKYRLTDMISLKYGCTCSSETAANIIRNIPETELPDIADENGYIEIVCKFCGKKRKKKVLWPE